MAFRKKSKAEDPKTASDEWTVLEGDVDGVPTMIRVRSGLKASVGHPSYGLQMGVAIPLNNPDPGGMPSIEEHRELKDVEDTLEELAADNAVLAAVVTTGEMREFVLYTGTSDWIESFHLALEAAVPSHEIQVIAQHDANWDVFRSLGGLK